MRCFFIIVAVASGLLVSVTAAAQLGKFVGRPGPKLYVSPGRTFRVQLFNDWGVVPRPGDSSLIEFRPTKTQIRIFIHVRRVRVPAGASSMQMALNAREQRLRELPHWQEHGQRKVIVGGRPAVVITGQYAFQGNIQYPITLEEVYVVVDEEAFVIHFECFTPDAGRYTRAMETFYSTFIPRPSPVQLKPPAERSITTVPF